MQTNQNSRQMSAQPIAILGIMMIAIVAAVIPLVGYELALDSTVISEYVAAANEMDYVMMAMAAAASCVAIWQSIVGRLVEGE